MAPKLALLFLSVLLLLLTHGHGSSARELAEQKQENQPSTASNGATSVSKEDDSYASGYSAAYTSKKNTNPSHNQDDSYTSGYSATYASKKHTHPSDDQDDIYTPGYRALYTSKKHTHPSHTQDDSYTSGYTAAYASKKHTHPSPNQDDSYTSGYSATYASKKHTHPSDNQDDIYTPGYRALYTSKKHNHPSHSQDDSYTSGYSATYTSKKHTHPSDNQDDIYTPGYKAIYTSQKHTHPSDNQNDIYTPGYKAIYTSKKHTHPSHNQDDSYTSQYAAAYAPRKHIHPSQHEDIHKPHQPYLTGYRNTQKDHKETDKPYTSTYGTAKSVGQDLEESKGEPSSKGDHTEAFKTGFFTLDDLYAGNIMTLQFPVKDFPHFLPKKIARYIPFSTSQLPSVFQLFSISEDSPRGQAMKDTLEQCEVEPLTGETKACVTSLESMLEFVHSILGTGVNYNILTTSYPTTSSAPLQNYTVLQVSQDIYAPKWIACHPLPYPYAVFFCHFIDTGSKVFKVSLGGENGDNMEALGLCHLDTSEWSPDHSLFQQLGTKPGEAPVCHFFPAKHLLWVPLPTKASM